MAPADVALGQHIHFLQFACDVAGANFAPIQVSARESISAPYSVVVDVLSDRRDIKADEILYRKAALSFCHTTGPVRYFHGLVRQFSSVGNELRDRTRYTLELVPKLWFTALTSDCRVFVNKTVEDIVTAVLRDAEFENNDVQFRVYGAKRVREYTVQLNETDLVFISRLLQEEGWFYFFEHGASGHTLVVSDQNTAFAALGDPKMDCSAPYYDDALLYRWAPSKATTHGLISLMDYDPTAPRTNLEATETTQFTTQGAKTRDVFRWPADSLKNEEIEARSRMRMEAAEVEASLIDGSGRNPAFRAGTRFVLKKDPLTGAEDQVFVLRTVVHEASEDVTRNSVTTVAYTNSFTAFPVQLPWRDPVTLHRPHVPGVFTATVIGRDGEEIHTDELGRVKIRFPWDRRKSSTAEASIWVRVIQPWTGARWGTQFIPRVGTEVAVAFVDGNVDRPVVLGGLYNGDDKPPFTLPTRKTVSGLRTRSTLKGGAADYSELSFDDDIGNELVTFQAQKDLSAKIKNNETRSVGASQSIEVGQDRSVVIDKGDDSLHVKQGDVAVAVDQGDLSIDVKQGDLSVHLGMGDVSVKADLGSVTIEAMQSLTLKVGNNTVTIDQTGISLKGLMINYEAQLMANIKGLMLQVQADAIATVKGALLMLN